MIDIDFFKKINDRHGHLTGDRVLAAIAVTISKTIRQYDSAYRYGGEELGVLLPESGIDDALLVAERIRRKIAGEEFVSDDGKKLNVTVSLGVAAFRPGLTDMKELIAEADAALYYAKQNGRNQVACLKDNEYRRITPGPDEENAANADIDEIGDAPSKRTRRKSKMPPA
jgi:diguanylate cyclase (GGDEF)-like protein